MGKIDILFAWPEEGDAFGKVIDFVEGPEYDPCHCGAIFDGVLYEALPKGFVKSSPDDYANRKTEILPVEVLDLSAALAMANQLLYTPYGWPDCINGGIYELTGKQLPGDGTITVNCSEAVARILRAGGVDVLPGIYADCVTPAMLYEFLKGESA